MFDFFLGWRKASKCKKLIKRVQCRLKLLKNKRSSIVRQLREDIAQLVKIGYEDIAVNRAEQLFKDESTIEVYELLDNFCEFIIIHLSYIRKHKDCPNDINEAISSLIFASARCGDLPELPAIRKLFAERYDQRFEMTALELLPGNLVNLQVKEKLSLQSVTDDMKKKLVDEIAKENCPRPEILVLEHPTQLQQQIKEQGLIVSHNGSQMENTPGKAMDVDSASISKSLNVGYLSRRNSDIITTSVSSPIARQSSTEIMDSPENNQAENNPDGLKYANKHESVRSYKTEENKEQKMTASSPESLPQFQEEMVVYLDDIEEVQSPDTKDGGCQDRRIFKFKTTSAWTTSEKVRGNPDDKCVDWFDSQSDMKRVKTTKKGSRRRSFSQENLSSNDIGSVIYYNKPRNKWRNRRSEISVKWQSRCFNLQAEDCCLKHPFYFSIGDGKNAQKVPSWNAGSRTIHGCIKQDHMCNHINHCYCSTTEESEPETKIRYDFSPMPVRRSCEIGAISHDHFTGLDEEIKIIKGQGKGLSPSCDMFSNATSPLTRQLPKPPYVRAMTMPQERSDSCRSDNVLRSKSFPVQSSQHVHPKLPDYDDIAAKFMALRKEHQQSRY